MLKVQRPPHSHMLMHSLHYWWQCGLTAVKKAHTSDEVVRLALNKSGFCVVFNKIPLSLLKGSNEQ